MSWNVWREIYDTQLLDHLSHDRTTLIHRLQTRASIKPSTNPENTGRHTALKHHHHTLRVLRPYEDLRAILIHFQMSSSKPLPKWRKSYSVPKQELRATSCFTTLNVKRAVNEPACDNALEKLRYDLARKLSKTNVRVPVSTENKISGNWIALAMPDAIPSRLGLMTRIASLVAVCDGSDDGLALNNASCDNFTLPFTSDLAEALPATLDHRQPSERRCNGSARQTKYRAIFEDHIKPVLSDLLSTDRSMGFKVLTAWYHHCHEPFATSYPTVESPLGLESPIHSSLRAFPGNPWVSTLRYALGLHLEDAELEVIEPAVAAAMQSVALTRDYWAWPRDSCSADNVKRLQNAVAISMVERQCSEAQAMVVVKNAAIAAERRFLDRKRDLVEAMGKQHSEVVMFLDAVEHFAAGNSLWCSSCPLYHRRR